MKKFLLFFYIFVFCFTSYLAAVPVEYPHYRYVVTPIARMTEETGKSNELFPNVASMHFQVQEGPGVTTSYWLLNVSFGEYQEFLSQPPPQVDDAVAKDITRLLKELQVVAHDHQKAMPMISVLGNKIGLVRTLYIVQGLGVYPLSALQAMAGVKPEPTKEPFLSLRRFGIMRHRGPEITAESFNGKPKSLDYVLKPLVRDRYAHLVVGDIQIPFLPHTIPSPVQLYPDVRMSEFFSVANKSVLVPMHLGSEEVHDLSYRAYAAQITRGMSNVDADLLNSLKSAAQSLDLTRLFFYVIEDYVYEKPLQTISFIDGGSKDFDFYELPVEKRFQGLKLRERFPSETLIEVHGLAFDPDIKGDQNLGINTEAWAAQILDFIHNGGHDKTRFVVQAHSTAARFYEKKMGLELIEESKGYFQKDILVLHNTGAKIKEEIMKRFPNLRVVLSAEVPNRLNRRQPNYHSDRHCIQLMKRAGMEL